MATNGNGKEEKIEELKKVLKDLLDWSIRKPNRDYAYSRCRLCDCSWWDEKEQHKQDCITWKIKKLLYSIPPEAALTEAPAVVAAPPAAPKL